MMKSTTLHKLSLFTSLFAVAAFFVAVIVGYGTYDASERLKKEYQYELEALRREVARLNNELTTIAGKIPESQTQSTETIFHKTPGAEQPTNKRASSKTTALQPEVLNRLQEIVESTGLDQLATRENIDPDILREIYDQYTERKQITAYRQSLLEQNNQMHSIDAQHYDKELHELYQQAHLRRIRDLIDEDSEKAFNIMVEKYPEANATAMVIAERALSSAWRRNTADVEKYYNMLQENPNEDFLNVVIDRGIEAVPNIERYLAWQYMSEGRNKEAAYLIESLERNYAESLVLVRGGGGRPRWVPVSEVVPILKQQNELER